MTSQIPWNSLYPETLVKFASRGYSREKVEGRFHWLWRISDTFPLYVREREGLASSVFIDAIHAELCKLLSTVQGIQLSKDGARKNGKFKAFQFKRVLPHSGRVEYEGWKLCITSEAGCLAFMEICEAYDQGGIQAASDVASGFERQTLRKTSRKSVREVRVGQPDFRRDLLKRWKSCAVTGCTVEAALRASHMKPWAVSTSQERLDPFNGLLLTANLDALFDAGLISFDGDGRILISSGIKQTDYPLLGISAEMRLRKINTAHEPYLEYHRQQVFVP